MHFRIKSKIAFEIEKLFIAKNNRKLPELNFDTISDSSNYLKLCKEFFKIKIVPIHGYQ